METLVITPTSLERTVFAALSGLVGALDYRSDSHRSAKESIIGGIFYAIRVIGITL